MTSDPGKREPLADPQGIDAQNRLTMSEAARLKGVSYHTVSRAVRRGRLPVIRLGRMALINADDLEAWEPMRERAPRKYRRTPVPADQAASPVSLVSADRVELAHQLASLYDVIHSASTGGSMAHLAQVAVERIAETFGLTRMTMWRLDPESGMGERLAIHREAMSNLPQWVSLEDAPFLMGLTANPHCRVLSSREEIEEYAHATRYILPEEPILVVPLVRSGRPVGLMFGDREGRPIDFTPDQLVLADMIANQMGMAIENSAVRDLERQRRMQLEAILGELSSAVSAFDAEGRLTLANAAERQLFDLTEDEARLGQPMEVYLGHKRLESMEGVPYGPDDHAVLKAFQGHPIRDLQRVVVRKDGTHRYVRTNARPILADGKVVGAVTVSEDWTAEHLATRRESERLIQLERAAQRSRSLADLVVEINAGQDAAAVAEVALARLAIEIGARAGFVVLQAEEGQYEVAATHGSVEGILPVEPGRLVETNPTTGAFGQYRPILVPATAMDFDSGIDSSILIVPLQMRGQRVGVAYLVLDDGRMLEESDLSFAAVWGRQCAQAIDKALLVDQLAFAHGRIMAIIDQLVQAVVIVDAPDGRVSMSNQAAERLWGRSLDDEHVLATSLPVVDEEGMPLRGRKHPLVQSLRTRREHVGEPLTVIRKDGAQVDVLASHSPIFDGRGAVVGSVSVLQDRADFVSLDRSKDEFISVVAHELRNPLTSLRGNLQLLQRRFRKRQDDTAGQDVERVDSVITQVDRINDLVGRMLDVSRAGLGRLDVSPEPCDATVLVGAVISEAQGLDPEQTFAVDVPESLPVVWDEARIQQVLRNLTQNAARYAPGTEVDVRMAVTAGGRVRISVRDHGPGVPPAIKRRLFRQYYRFDDGRGESSRMSDGGRGLGIGLYVSARIVRAHGGSLTVDDAEGGGAVFTVELPLDAGSRSEIQP